MKINYKYKAFTLTETVFGLIISGILIGVIYTVFTTFNKQFIIFQKQQLITNDFMLFDTTFNKDMYDAATIHYNNETLHLKQYDETVIHYSFKGNSIKRKHDEHTEVLFSKVISHTFENKKNHIVMVVKLQLHGETIILNYYKKYAPDQIINSAFIEEVNIPKI